MSTKTEWPKMKRDAGSRSIDDAVTGKALLWLDKQNLDDMDEATAIGQQIVTAVNAFPALVAACEEVVDRLAHSAQSITPSVLTLRDCAARLRQAIAGAKP